MRRREGEFKMKCSFGGARCRAVTGHHRWCTGEEECKEVGSERQKEVGVRRRQVRPEEDAAEVHWRHRPSTHGDGLR